MGYTTDFAGSFKLDKPLTAIHIEYLNMFADTRRMKRDPTKLHLMKLEGRGNTRCFKLLEELGLPMGADGDYYCGTGFSGQDRDESIVEYNYAPGEGKYNDPIKPVGGQPGLWCQWNPSDDGTQIVWDGSEKFYHYTEWLKYLIENFLKPWGYKVSGLVEWKGEDSGDYGVIEVTDNDVITHDHKKVVDLFSPLRNDDVPDAEKAAKMTESAIAASEAFAESKAKASNTPEIILDLVKLRNELVKSKKGTAVACKKLDELIKKYGV